MKNKTTLRGLITLFVFALIYGASQTIGMKILSFVLVTICTEFYTLYLKNQRVLFECLDQFNGKYYDIYCSVITMHIRLATLCIITVFPCFYEIFESLWGSDVWIEKKLMPFMFAFFISVVIMLFALVFLNNRKFIRIANELYKMRKTDFTSDFKKDELKKISEITN